MHANRFMQMSLTSFESSVNSMTIHSAETGPLVLGSGDCIVLCTGQLNLNPKIGQEEREPGVSQSRQSSFYAPLGAVVPLCLALEHLAGGSQKYHDKTSELLDQLDTQLATIPKDNHRVADMDSYSFLVKKYTHAVLPRCEYGLDLRHEWYADWHRRDLDVLEALTHLGFSLDAEVCKPVLAPSTIRSHFGAPLTQVENDLLVTCQRGQEGVAPIVCIYAGLGMGYGSELVSHFDERQPIYASQAPEFTSPYRFDSMEHRASHHARVLKKRFPNVTIHLVGYSMGGVLCLEVARKLDTQQCACTLTLVDPLPWCSMRPSTYLGRRLFNMILLATGSPNGDVPGFRDIRAQISSGNISDDFSFDEYLLSCYPEDSDVLRPFRSISCVASRYQCEVEDYLSRPQPRFHRHATLFKLDEGAVFFGEMSESGFDDNGEYGWRNQLDHVDVVEVHGQHTDFFTHSPNVERICRHLKSLVSGAVSKS